MMPEDFAMLSEVSMNFLYELVSLSDQTMGIWEEWIGGTPGISKNSFTSLKLLEVVLWMVARYKNAQRPEAPLV